MNMDEVWNELGTAKELDDSGVRTKIILAALDGLNIREAKLLLSRISTGLEGHTLDYSSSDMQAVSLEGIRHAAEKKASPNGRNGQPTISVLLNGQELWRGSAHLEN